MPSWCWRLSVKKRYVFCELNASWPAVYNNNNNNNNNQSL
jgi:hypothetical protein